MTNTISSPNSLAIEASQSILETVFGHYHPRNFTVRFWNQLEWKNDPAYPSRFTLVLQHPGAVRQMFLPPTELSLAEAYIFNDYDIEGDIEAVFPVVTYLQSKQWSRSERFLLGKQLLRLPKDRAHNDMKAAMLHGKLHSPERDQQAVAYHYNRSNAFYAQWLDQRMIYSCAYFRSPDDDLDTAQEQKLDLICRKLRLKPGEHLLDIGCGWGGLMIYAARHYGVMAHGITLSDAQVELAQQRIREAGLEDRCRVEQCDYRALHATQAYDKLVSIGMFEHVGRTLLPTYFQQAFDLLKPGGVFLNHGITSRIPAAMNADSFVGRYVFPDGDLVPIHITLKAAENAGFEVRDVDGLREHYALTLQHWVQNLETHASTVRQLTDDVTYRIWRLYMAGARYGFITNQSSVYQTLFAKPSQGISGLPLTRADWYQ